MILLQYSIEKQFKTFINYRSDLLNMHICWRYVHMFTKQQITNHFNLIFYTNLCQKYQDTKLLTIRCGVLKTALQNAMPYSFHRAHHFDTSKMTKVSENLTNLDGIQLLIVKGKAPTHCIISFLGQKG